MLNFIYDIPTKVYFGKGQIKNLSKELKKIDGNALLVYGGGSIKKIGLYDEVLKEIELAGVKCFELSGVEPNPRIDTVRLGVKLCKENDIKVVLAVGGGSTIDASKFICAGALTETDPWDFFVKGAPIDKALPLISVLTLSATGSEMDNCGVISNPNSTDKLGRADYNLFPTVSFLDPTYTYSVNKYQTACGSADILSHVLETYFSKEKDLFMLDGVMEAIMKTVIKYAPIAMSEPENYEARANLMWASSWAINGFIIGGKIKTWSCHPLEHQLTANYGVTHGLGLAVITPKWMKYCLDDSSVDRFVSFGVNVFDIDKTLDKFEIANLAISKLEEFLYKTLNLADTFEKAGIGTDKIEFMAEKACKNGCIDGFKPLYKKDIEQIFKMCI